ncbi:MAG TPA: signal peptidase I [Spirochaetia bacterium]|nr:signal peptidase I [Spirochaetia bacterium]
MDSLPDRVQAVTERFLTWYKGKRIARMERRSRIPAVLDWFYTFLWAILIILILNQYLFQFYVIPSGSMEDTLLIHDRISVNKLIFGPELLPGMVKLPALAEPHHGDIITFKNPGYASRGPLFDIVQRFVFMLTLSMVNLDTDKNGRPAIHYLIKRVIATGGDRIRIDPTDGSMMMLPAGTGRWVSEAEFKRLAGLHYHTIRIFNRSDYAQLLEATKADLLYNAGLPVSTKELKAADTMPSFYDYKVYEEDRAMLSYELYPQSREIAEQWSQFENGWYVAPGYVFPMGDNRDDSRDGRYFGPVPLRIVLGQATYRFWPPARIGPLK